MTYTYAVLPVSQAAFDEIQAKLRAGGYEDAFHEGATLIDMHGIAIQAERQPSARGQEEEIALAFFGVVATADTKWEKLTEYGGMMCGALAAAEQRVRALEAALRHIAKFAFLEHIPDRDGEDYDIILTADYARAALAPPSTPRTPD